MGIPCIFLNYKTATLKFSWVLCFACWSSQCKMWTRWHRQRFPLMGPSYLSGAKTSQGWHQGIPCKLIAELLLAGMNTPAKTIQAIKYCSWLGRICTIPKHRPIVFNVCTHHLGNILPKSAKAVDSQQSFDYSPLKSDGYIFIYDGLSACLSVCVLGKVGKTLERVVINLSW